MAYATQDDLVPLRLTQKDLVELTDDDDTGDVDADIVTAALTEASGRVDSYCRGRYVTPLQASESLKALTLDIAIYVLFTRRRETRVSETVSQRYQDAIAFLKDISTGKASLDQPATSVTPQSSQAGPEISCKDQHLRFSDCEIEGFV